MSGIGKALMMEYQQIVRDFTKRTRVNLAQIENSLSEGSEVYEVTQLVNSLLGLLVFPEQRYFHQIPKTPLHELEKQGWPKIKVVGECPPANDLREQMRYLRNSIAHFNLRFFTNEQSEISGIRIWNINTRIDSHPKTWEAVISLVDLRILVNKFVDLILREAEEQAHYE
jgi:hypothetical protein